jgi:hypothetical protein
MLWPSQMSKKSKPDDKSMMDIDNDGDEVAISSEI